MVEGYNIAIKLNSKTVVGRTQEDLSISALSKESITKDNAGVKQSKVTGHEVTLKVAALCEVGNSETTKIDRDDVIEMALKVGSEAIIPITYVCAGGDTYAGNAIITGYSESSAADPDTETTLSLDLKVTGAFTKQTTGGGSNNG